MRTIPRGLRKRSRRHHFRATTLKAIDVWPVGLGGRCGKVRYGAFVLPCALGRSGPTPGKREGDGCTPIGRFPIRRIHVRSDRQTGFRRGSFVRTINTWDGWCDAPDHQLYNRLVRLPFPQSHETLWRDDELYDLFLELGYNDNPPRPNKGSAIFFHVARPGFTPTEGCVAIDKRALLRLVRQIGQKTLVRIGCSPMRP